MPLLGAGCTARREDLRSAESIRSRKGGKEDRRKDGQGFSYLLTSSLAGSESGRSMQK